MRWGAARWSNWERTAGRKREPIKRKDAKEAVRRLLLIRHARTVVQPGLEPAAWPLHDTALRAVDALAEQLVAYPISALVSSSEPKAIATAVALGQRLSLAPR